MPSSPPHEPGRLLDGRYRLLTHLADGGMASVWLALDERLEREVALKILRPGLAADQTFVNRFRQEARSAARLSHPGLVAMFDQGQDGADLFLAMEYLPGRTLREVLAEEAPLPVDQALDIMDQMLDALASAHRAGMVHRDIKPENVIVRSDGTVKVADFGLARAVTTATEAGTDGVLLGTASYLSPEQVEHGSSDARSDVYACGLVLFEMLTGVKAVDGETAVHIAFRHVQGGIPAPSSLVPGLPTSLDHLVALATARDPERRPDSAGDLLVELRHTRTLLPVAAAGVGMAATQRLDLSAVVADPAGASLPAPLDRTAALTLPAIGTELALPEPESPAPPRRRRRRPGLGVGLLVVVLAVLGAWWFLLGPGATVVVPSVVGLSQDKAVSVLQTSHLGADVGTAFSETVASGVVISVDPTAGADVHRGSTVALTVSKGPERFAVPNLVNTPAADAKATLAGAHLALGDQSQAYSETVAKGLIISQDPKAGTPLKLGSTVAITVSQGRTPITLPDLTGQPIADALATLDSLGLKAQQQPAAYSDTVAKGAVISENPGAGSVVYKGDTVTLVPSKGPQFVTIPDLFFAKESDAKAKLEALGLVVKIKKVGNGSFGRVQMSDPPSGTRVQVGSTVTLYVA